MSTKSFKEKFIDFCGYKNKTYSLILASHRNEALIANFAINFYRCHVFVFAFFIIDSFFSSISISQSKEYKKD